MNISSVGTTNIVNPAQTSVVNSSATADTNETTNVEDAVVYSKSNESSTESSSSTSSKSYAVDQKEVQRLLDESNQATERFKEMILKLVENQANKNSIANGTSSSSEMNSLLSQIYGGGNANVEVDEATRLQAQADVGEDGYYGVKQTSARILDFAKAISGGDPSKFETLKQAVKDGFQAAADVMGGGDMNKMPQITRDTYDAVMQGFDDWEAEMNGSSNA